MAYIINYDWKAFKILRKVSFSIEKKYKQEFRFRKKTKQGSAADLRGKMSAQLQCE